MHTTPATGQLSITLPDGTELYARTDVVLARKWAEHECGPAAWAALPYPQQIVETTAALAELRRAAAAG